MTRTDATKYLRQRLDEYSLNDWHIRLSTNINATFLGMCSPKDKTIILNAHHIDTHPEIEVIETINHEVAHALTLGHAHDDIWAAKARELGCKNTLPCATYGLSAVAIDAIRSGADVKVDFEEHVIRTPKYNISKLQDKCPTCGKVAKVLTRKEANTSSGRKVVITYECFHVIIKDADSQSPFETITFDGDTNCKHEWNKTVCLKCNAKRLYPYQIEGARFLEKANGRAAVFDEMGLGKTIQALAYLKFNKTKAWPFLWVTKSGIKFQHGKEIIRVLGMEAFPQVLLTGKDKLIPGMNVVASYDIFKRMDIKQFIDHGFKTIILDECQAIKNPDSSRTQSIRQIARDIPGIIPLSGTPWKNRGSEFFVVLNMLDSAKFQSYQRFKDHWVNYYYDSGKYKEGGIRNPARFKEEIAHIALRRERTEVMPELPLVNRTEFLCDVPEHARKVYNEEQANLIRVFNDAVISGTEDSFETHQQVMQSLIIMRQIVGIAKVPATVEYAKEFLEDTDRKLVIFVHHKKCGELIVNALKEYCKEEELLEPLQLSADMNAIERSNVASNFNDGPYRILVASTLASGEGLNLQKCSDCIMHERQWNPANEEQAEGRFVRIGQTAQSVNATYVHGSDTVDTTLHGIVERKRIEFVRGMNKESNFIPIWNEQGIVKQLAQALSDSSKGKKWK
jgi:superfamily II DNA or RNA helicase